MTYFLPPLFVCRTHHNEGSQKKRGKKERKERKLNINLRQAQEWKKGGFFFFWLLSLLFSIINLLSYCLYEKYREIERKIGGKVYCRARCDIMSHFYGCLTFHFIGRVVELEGLKWEEIFFVVV